MPPPSSPLLCRQFDCSRLKAWPRAVRACEVTQASARGEASLAEFQALSTNERMALFAFFTAGNRSKQLHFHNVCMRSLCTPISSSLHFLCTPRSAPPQVHIDSLAPYTQDEVFGRIVIAPNPSQPSPEPPTTLKCMPSFAV